ncbi:10485_t:CDS:2, partial [Racocetra persica]
KLIQDIEDGTSFIHKHPRNMGKHLSNSLIRELIVKLGVMYNLASKYTSFLVIDERDNELVAEAKTLPAQRIVPVAAVAYSAYSYVSSPSPKALYRNFSSIKSLSGMSATRKTSNSIKIPQFPGGRESLEEANISSSMDLSDISLHEMASSFDASDPLFSMSSNDSFKSVLPTIS